MADAIPTGADPGRRQHGPAPALESAERDLVAGTSLWKDAWKRVRKNRAALAGGVVVAALVVLSFVGPVITRIAWGFGYETQDLAYGARPPTLGHWFGTDFFGRDLLTRVLSGCQVSIAVGLLAAVVAATIGTVYGATAGYVGGPPDNVMMRFVDLLYSLPYMFLVIILAATFRRSLMLMFVALGCVGWLTTARIVRGQVLSLKQREFVLAARSVGVGTPGILFRHLIPNTLGPIIVTFTLTVPQMILQEAFLSFLGLGVQAPRPSLGAIIKDGADHMDFFWWELATPAAVMAALLFSLNFIGDGLRDALDPHMKS